MSRLSIESEFSAPRFRFGDNWRRFAASIDQRQIDEAIRGLRSSLDSEDLAGRVFLDIGCGSGLHSLAAQRLGASEIFSFDFDTDSVACTRNLKERFAPRTANWRIAQGSILDSAFLQLAPQADDVYSWGVLHHTGEMWTAIRNAARKCRGPGSRFMIGIYNEKRPATDLMKVVKKTFVISPRPVQAAIKWSYWGVTAAAQVLRGRSVLAEIRERHSERGMNYWRDLEDWVGGYPYECARPAQVKAFVGALGFELKASRTRNTIASVNEYLFCRK